MCLNAAFDELLVLHDIVPQQPYSSHLAPYCDVTNTAIATIYFLFILIEII